MKLPHFRHDKGLVAGIAAVVVIVSLGGVILATRHHAASTPESQVKATVAEVGKIIELPTNEKPTLATVTNQSEVRKQPFFIHADNGDKVLIYANNKLAILYRPSQHKLINVGPINGVVSYARFSVTIRNGTTTASLLQSASNKLTASFPNAKIAETAAAQRNNFPSTIVIPVKEADQDLAAQTADALGGQVGIMPLGEETPTSDILIILGQNYQP